VSSSPSLSGRRRCLVLPLDIRERQNSHIVLLVYGVEFVLRGFEVEKSWAKARWNEKSFALFFYFRRALSSFLFRSLLRSCDASRIGAANQKTVNRRRRVKENERSRKERRTKNEATREQVRRRAGGKKRATKPGFFSALSRPPHCLFFRKGLLPFFSLVKKAFFFVCLSKWPSTTEPSPSSPRTGTCE